MRELKVYELEAESCPITLGSIEGFLYYTNEYVQLVVTQIVSASKEKIVVIGYK